MNNNSQSSTSAARPTHEQIAIRAELLWKAKGSPSGQDEQIWLEAERQLFDEAKEIIAPSESESPRATSPAQSTSASSSAQAEQMAKPPAGTPARSPSPTVGPRKRPTR